MSIERHFDASFVAGLALREKQVQQSYRPVIGIHKWFARRPGSVFRSLLLAEFVATEPLASSYWRPHRLRGVIADPFMGGGTTIYEASRLGFSVVGADINPMAHWIVCRSLASLDLGAFREAAEKAVADVEADVGDLYRTRCVKCGAAASVKYFLWVKRLACPGCGVGNDLFPGYLLAEAVRHPRHVVVCRCCGTLNEYETAPRRDMPATCRACGHAVHVEGPARRNRIQCYACNAEFRYPPEDPAGPPPHRMWAIEYHCSACRPSHTGRFFKHPDADDNAAFERAATQLRQIDGQLPIPDQEVPPGDETDRLHRWGYRRFRELFNDRQLLGLGLLLRRIADVDEAEVRYALLTVFSDFLRYQNMLCRYDTYALKCQDIFSVHGFPVGLVQCENSLLGIPGVGSGAFRHFVEKYTRAKRYCQAPFETRHAAGRKQVIAVPGERIAADLVDRFPNGNGGEAYLAAAPAVRVRLPPASLDGIFTDPPYFDNVQYAELMDFCYAWLREGLKEEFEEFRRETTRAEAELTGNATLGRGLEHFTRGLSEVFCHYARALKPGAPMVFTFHHNDPAAYVPIVVAILDTGLDCTAALPAPAEMSASLHIAGTSSSVIDTIFVCRSRGSMADSATVPEALAQDVASLAAGGVRLTAGDIGCMLAGHIARVGVNSLWAKWNADAPLEERMARARRALSEIAAENDGSVLIPRLLEHGEQHIHAGQQLDMAL